MKGVQLHDDSFAGRKASLVLKQCLLVVAPNAAFPWAFSEAFDPTTPRGLSVPLRPAQALCEPA